MCMAASWMSKSLSSWTGQTEHQSFQNEPSTSKGFVPSVLSLSENTAHLTSSWFHSGEYYQLCIKCSWRARFSCHTFQTAIALCSAALSETRGVTSHFSNICFSFFVWFFFPGINLSPQQTTVLLKRGSAPFLKEQVPNAKKIPCSKVAGHRFQTLIALVSMEINVTSQCVQCELYLFFPLQTRKELKILHFPLGIFCQEF